MCINGCHVCYPCVHLWPSKAIRVVCGHLDHMDLNTVQCEAVFYNVKP